MPNLLEKFTQEVITERELKKLMPDWPNTLIRDYIAFKRDVFITAEEVDNNLVTETSKGNNQAQLNDINNRLGSGDTLTSDETGFTVDLTTLTVDMAEA